jgi:hypothetical protein
MALTAEHRAELEVLGPETVRIRLRSSDLVTVISGFKTPTTRSDIEGWLTEKRIQGESDRRQWSWTIQHMFSHPLQRRLFCYRWT